MKVDNVGQCLYSADEAFTLIMQGIDIESIYIENCDDLNLALKHYECNDFNRYMPVSPEDEHNFHRLNQNLWKMPIKYMDLDICKHLRSSIVMYSNPEYETRLELELKKFEDYNLLDVLRYMKYMIDTFKKNNIVWGVGRGSSVASLCLYLLDVHSIDPVIYNIKFDEFLE